MRILVTSLWLASMTGLVTAVATAQRTNRHQRNSRLHPRQRKIRSIQAYRLARRASGRWENRLISR